jgi:hypothetical protein
MNNALLGQKYLDRKRKKGQNAQSRGKLQVNKTVFPTNEIESAFSVRKQSRVMV